MKTRARVDAGICGFQSDIAAACADDQHVDFEIISDCEKVRSFAAVLKKSGSVDAFREISPASESLVLSAARETLKGCCAACAAPVGVFKAMQVAAGLALPKDIAIRIAKGE
ncbi:MAG: hypothetical protein V2A58_04960 [Planctomycetota bacterium]